MRPIEFTVERYVGKIYDEVTTREITLTSATDWPQDLYVGRVVDLEVKAQGPDGPLETFRLFGKVTDIDGQVLRIKAEVVGERPVRVWSMP